MKFQFPPPIQWKLPFLGADVSVVGVAWGPADSPEMLSKGRESRFSQGKAEFFPDRPYALAIHLQLVSARPNNSGTLSGLVRVKDVEGNLEHPLELTSAGFVAVNVGFQFTGNTRLDYWEFFPVSPEDKNFLFEVLSNPSESPLSFRVIVKPDQLVIVKASPGGEPASLKFARTFAGVLGAESEAEIRLTANGSELSGTERYAHIGKTLWLKGALDSLGNFQLKEYYPQDQLTGIFDGSFSNNYREMTGYFSKPDGSRLQPFDFKEIAALPPGEHSSACPPPNPPAGWKTYLNDKYRFCLAYPDIYTLVDKPWEPKDAEDPQYSRKLQQAAEQDQLSRLDDDREASDSVVIQIEPEPFDLQQLTKRAPTGEESPPQPTQIGRRTFYYYGPGGGGVCYPDQFFYDLKGKTLAISFTGPCVDDRTPTPQTKVIEQQMLATFGTY